MATANDILSKYKIDESSSANADSILSKYGVSEKPELSMGKKIGIGALRGVQFLGGMLPNVPGTPIDISSFTTTPATEYAIQRLEKKSPEEAKKQAAIASGIDLAGGMVFPVGSTALIGLKGLLKSGEKKVTKEITKPTVAHGLGQIVGGLSNRDVKRIVRDKIPVGSGANLSDLYGNATKKIETLIEGKKDLVNDIYKRGMEEKGISPTTIVNVKNLKSELAAISKEFEKRDVAKLGKGTSEALKNINKSIGKTDLLALDQVKNIKKALHDITSQSYDEGVGSWFTGLAKRAEKAAILDESVIPGMPALNKEYQNIANPIQKVQNIFRLKLREGELPNQQFPLATKLMRLKNEDRYFKQLRGLDAANKQITKKLGKDFGFMDDLDVALITDKLTKAGKEGMTTTGFGATPKGILKSASNLIGASPVMRARYLSALGKLIPQGTLAKEVSSVFPKASTIEKLIPNAVKKGVLKGTMQYGKRNLEGE